MQVVETVSVVVTDLVGSTRMESRIGPVAADALREEHFLVLRAALEAAGGDEVKTMGDGLMIVFHGAAHAVACAVSIQQRMERRNRRALEPLGIRVGIALGDATPADGDWFGPAVVEAVRLCDRAVAGQILASELVQLIGARDGHPFSPVGELALKGLPQPVIAYEIEWEPARGWAADVPPPARLHAAASGRYVGRTDERARVEERWHAARGGARQTVFVEGEPGIGKTRFTSRAALELHDDGATVLLGRCVEEVRAPYGAFIEALSHLVEHAPDDALREHVERHGASAPPSLRARPCGDERRGRALPVVRRSRRAARAGQRRIAHGPRARRPALGRRAHAHAPEVPHRGDA
jgi:class 3 adenylate cyclase